MTTLDNLVERIFRALEGHSLDQGQLTWLTSELASDALEIFVNDATKLAPGVCEVGNELVYLDSFVDVENKGTIAPFGRGYRGSTAETHPVNTVVRVAPAYFRVEVLDKVNDTLRGLYPSVWGVATTTIAVNPSRVTYELPADTADVLAVATEVPGPSGQWQKVQRWKFQGNAHTDYASGRTLDVYDGVVPGYPLHVLYRKIPSALTWGDDFSVSGLQDSAVSMVLYGTLYRLLMDQEVGRLPNDHAAAAMIDGAERANAATLARQYLALYQQELEAERVRLNDRTPASVHWQE